MGLGRKGRYHLECISLRKDLTVVAVCDAGRSRHDVAEQFNVRFTSDERAFVSDPAIDLVLLTSSPRERFSLVNDALAAGKHVAVEAPLSLSLSDADAMLQAARRAERALTVIQHRHWDEDFRTVLELVRSGRLGRVTSARYLAWSYRTSEEALRDDNAEVPHVATPVNDAFLSFSSHRIDQLLELMPGRPESVFARLSTAGRELSETVVRGPLTLIVAFDDGATALVEINLGSLTPLQTGWVLAGTEGDYERFRRYEVTDEGEVFGVPVDTIGDERVGGLYEQLLQNVEDPADAIAAACNARDVVVMFEAVRESLRSGQVCSLGEESFVSPAGSPADFPLIGSAETGAS